MRLLYQWLFPVAWWSFVLYWWISAAWVRRIQTPEPPLARITHLTVGSVAILLFASPRFAVGPLGWKLWPQNKTTFLVGAALLLAGLGFAVWARICLGRFWSASVALKEGHRLICTGPYRWVRHPIYTGIIGGVAGTAVALGQLRGMVSLGLIIAIYTWKSRREERLLTGAFGDEYTRYRQGRAALIPFVF